MSTIELPNKECLLRKDGNANTTLKNKYLPLLSQKYPLLKDATFSEYVFNYINDITDIDVCPVCKINIKRFISIRDGYGKFCSTTCANVGNINKQKDTKSKFSKDKLRDIQYKTKETNMERYGVDNPSKNINIIERIKQTNLARYGAEWTGATQNNKSKSKETNLARYGCANPSQSHMGESLNFLSDYVWVYESYINQNKTAREIGSELNVDKSTVLDYIHKHDIAITYYSGYSTIALRWLDQEAFNNNIFIQHAMNVGEYCIPNTRYRVDGYCAETNTIYEFHGDCFHGNPDVFEPNDVCSPYTKMVASELYKKTIDREDHIKSLGYNLVVMWENNFRKII